MKNIPLIILLLTILSTKLFSQDVDEDLAMQNSRKYVSLRIKAISKYNARAEHNERILLKKLKKREKRFAKKLQRRDSASYQSYLQQEVNYDSIDRISKSKNSVQKQSLRKDKNISKIDQVQKASEAKTGLPAPTLFGDNANLESLQGNIQKRTYVRGLIAKRNGELTDIATSSRLSQRSLKGIQKNVFYSNKRVDFYKNVEEEPSLAEQRALDYLEADEKFSKELSRVKSAQSGIHSSNDAGESITGDFAEKGIQSKQMMEKSLGNKFGDALPMVTKNASTGVQKWKKDGEDLKSQAASAKQVQTKAGGLNKQYFRVNPMRGLPFSQRLEKQFNWQATRADAAGDRPAIIEPSVMMGFKHTPKLTYGIGTSVQVGLGQGWNNIRVTPEGIGARIFATWQLPYNIRFYAGYERVYKVRFLSANTISDNEIHTRRNNELFAESVLIGITKEYKIDKKHNGSLQILYDLWWQEKGLNNPILIRFSMNKK